MQLNLFSSFDYTSCVSLLQPQNLSAHPLQFLGGIPSPFHFPYQTLHATSSARQFFHTEFISSHLFPSHLFPCLPLLSCQVALAGAGASGEAAPAMLGGDWSSKAPQQPQPACYSISLTRTRYEFALCNSTASSGLKDASSAAKCRVSRIPHCTAWRFQASRAQWLEFLTRCNV